MKIAVFACFAVLLSGCVTLEPKSIGRDTYMVETMGTLMSSPSVNAAMAFCTKQGKNLQLISTNSAGIGPGARSMATFMCLTDDDPRYKAAVMRRDNGVTTIENR